VLCEKKDPAAEQAEAVFKTRVASAFTGPIFTESSTDQEARPQPQSLAEFMGQVRDTVQNSMPALLQCDRQRAKHRSQADGRIVVRVELSRHEARAQASIVENTTGDNYLAYCMVGKILSLSFPKPLRVSESFKIPVMVGS